MVDEEPAVCFLVFAAAAFLEITVILQRNFFFLMIAVIVAVPFLFAVMTPFLLTEATFLLPDFQWMVCFFFRPFTLREYVLPLVRVSFLWLSRNAAALLSVPCTREMHSDRTSRPVVKFFFILTSIPERLRDGAMRKNCLHSSRMQFLICHYTLLAFFGKE